MVKSKAATFKASAPISTIHDEVVAFIREKGGLPRPQNADALRQENVRLRRLLWGLWGEYLLERESKGGRPRKTSGTPVNTPKAVGRPRSPYRQLYYLFLEAMLELYGTPAPAADKIISMVSEGRGSDFPKYRLPRDPLRWDRETLLADLKQAGQERRKQEKK